MTPAGRGEEHGAESGGNAAPNGGCGRRRCGSPRTGSKEAAEDVTSQVFVKVLGALPTYRRDRPFRSWLFAIAHNAIADAHRAQRPHQPLSAAEDVLDPSASPEDLAVSAEG